VRIESEQGETKDNNNDNNNNHNHNNNNHNNKHAFAGATDSFTSLSVLLVLTDRGIYDVMY
jgi:ABC-type Zn2+ transport system substrate-binding protein/surface adhesin